MIFRNWVLQNFPFLEDDFDALTDYELFCKMMEYVKQFAKDNEEFNKRLTDLENYINNLDLQDEVNNKLDEMALDGTLENLIGQYIQLATTYVYNNVSDMKLATNLINGSFARTSGFYDGKTGGAYYKIREVINTDVIDEMTLIALNDTNLVAELIIEKTMSPKQFGAYGDEEHDDTLSIQTCLNTCNNIVFNNGTYLVDAEISLEPENNSYINIANATLKAITNNANEYAIIKIINKNNVKIVNGNIVGDRDTHTGATGEWGHCIWIQNSSNINLKNINMSKAWGDGLYIKSGTNIVSENLYINNTRRNGISVINVNGYHSINDYIENINGTAPQSGIDLEPNENTEEIKNVVIDNITCHNCSGDGIDIALKLLGANNESTIIINNPHITNCNNGIYGGYTQGLKGKVVFNNVYIKDVQNNGLYFESPYAEDGLKTDIISPYIKNYNLSNTSTRYGLWIATGSSNWGNVYISRPYIETTSEVLANCIAIVLGGNTNYHPVNVILDTPLNKQGNIFNAYGENVKILDTLEVYKQEKIENNTYSNPQENVNTLFTNKNNTVGARIYPRNYTSIGLDVTYRKLADYNFQIQLPTGHRCPSLSSNTGIVITLTNVGDSLTLRRVSADMWIVTNMIGTPTIS